MCIGKLISAHVIARYHWDFVWVLCLYELNPLRDVTQACDSTTTHTCLVETLCLACVMKCPHDAYYAACASGKQACKS